MHVHERAAEADVTRELAHVHAAACEDGEDAQAVRAGERRQDPNELVAGQVVEVNCTLLFHV
jgi:hypothetical protein